MEGIKRLIHTNKHQVAHIIPKNYEPVLQVQLVGKQQIPLEEADLRAVFSAFGELTKVEVANTTATVHFQELVAAFFAHKCLDAKHIQSLQSTLRLTWQAKPLSRQPLASRSG